MVKFFRNREELIGLALQSVLWVVLFGVGMRGLISTVEGRDYMSYILPGIVALSALGGAVGGGDSREEPHFGVSAEGVFQDESQLGVAVGNVLLLALAVFDEGVDHAAKDCERFVDAACLFQAFSDG